MNYIRWSIVLQTYKQNLILHRMHTRGIILRRLILQCHYDEETRDDDYWIRVRMLSLRIRFFSLFSEIAKDHGFWSGWEENVKFIKKTSFMTKHKQQLMQTFLSKFSTDLFCIWKYKEGWPDSIRWLFSDYILKLHLYELIRYLLECSGKEEQKVFPQRRLSLYLYW